MNHRIRQFCCFAALALAMPCSFSKAQTSDQPESSVTYDQVQPVFKKHCTGCHGLERERGNLNLSSTEGIKAGSSSGPVALAGKPDESLLYTLASHLETPRMPPGKPKIPQRELDLIRRWIESGMPERTSSESINSNVKPKANPQFPGPSASGLESPRVHVIPLPRLTAITALAINPVDGTVAVPGVRQVLIFADTGEPPVAAMAFPDGDIHALQFSRDGKWLLASGGIGAESGKVVAFDAVSGKRLFEIGHEDDVVLTFDLTSDRSLIALGGPGRVVKVFRTADGELVSTLRKHTDWILSIAFSPDDLLLASSDRFGGLQVWETQTGKPFHSLRGHTGAVNSVAWSADSERLLSGGQDGVLRIWDIHHGRSLKHWNAEIGGILSTKWTHSGLIVAGGRGKQVAVFDNTDQLKRRWPLADEVIAIATSADGNSVVTGDAAGNVAGWTIARGELIGNYPLPIAPQVARVEAPVPPRKPRSASTANPVIVTDAERELFEAREALASTDAAIKATEESLVKLKSSADAIRRLIISREAAVETSTSKRALGAK